MRRSHTPKKKSSRSQAAAASLKATTAAAGTDGEFAEFGAMAGPPARPEVSDVDSTTLQLKWLPPTHTGGSGLEISGYHVQMQVSGDSGYTTHTPDTGSALPELSVARLQANTWHEFRVAAVTAAGLGTPSPPSRPVLTQRAPKLAKEILRAQHALEKMRLELTEKREARLRLAREATLLQGGRDDPQQRQVQLARRALLSDQVVELEKAHSEQHRRLQGLHSQQARLESHQQAWRQQDEPAEDESPEKDAGGGAAAAPSQARRASFVSGGITAATDGGPGPRPRRGGGGMHDVVRTLEAYTRLFAKEDTFVEETYPEWDREAARAQLMNALGAHAIADGERNKIAYFNLALNRVRSGESHNVFNRVDDERLEKLALMFSRFDSDHDGAVRAAPEFCVAALPDEATFCMGAGVLEFADFCHIMLMVGTRLHTQARARTDIWVRGRVASLSALLFAATVHGGAAAADVSEGGREQRPAARSE